jgi:creatinine amidohydrolase
MKEFRLERLTYVEAEEFARKGAIVLLPVSPPEAHGPHLPLGVDFFGARTLAEMSAEKLMGEQIPAVIAPLLPYALADAAMPFAGTVTLRAETVKGVIMDIADSFDRHGFKGMVIVCQHLERPNLRALEEASSESTGMGMPVLTVNPFNSAWARIQALMKGEFPELDLHAGEWETAFCLWSCPDLVKKELIGELSPNWAQLRKKLYEEGCKDFVEAGGPLAYFGDPTLGTPELGQEIYEMMAKALTEEIREWIENLRS